MISLIGTNIRNKNIHMALSLTVTIHLVTFLTTFGC